MIDGAVDKVEEWFLGSIMALANFFMSGVRRLMDGLASNVTDTSFSLFEEKWFNLLFQESYGWIVLGILALTPVLAIYLMSSIKASKRVGDILKDWTAVVLYSIILFFILSVAIWVMNFLRNILYDATGLQVRDWLTTLLPEFTSRGPKLLSSTIYLCVLGPSWLLVVLNQWLVPVFTFALLISWSIRSLGGNKTRNLFKFVVGLGFAAFLTKLIYPGMLAVGFRIANGIQSPNGRATIGCLILAITLIMCCALFIGGSVIAVKMMDDSSSEITGDVTTRTDETLTVEGDVTADIDSMFSSQAASSPSTGSVNDTRLAATQTSLSEISIDNHLIESLERSDDIPDETISGQVSAPTQPRFEQESIAT